ncbi:MAG: hypothetical protein HY362_04620 [Candidatus Aenigmarchaeota archaeon]|nr:hypothetical protein [Candidatus Aenigmarchaeota archaeon]
MRKMLIAIPAFLAFILSGAPAFAHCPLCVGAVGMAVASAKIFGFDITIVGLLAGALAISSGLWVARLIKKEYFRYQLPIILILSYALTVIPSILLVGVQENVYIPVKLFGEIGSVFNKIYWVDKLLFGSVFGVGITLFAFKLHLKIKELYGKVLFPFQGVLLTVGVLAAASVVFQLALG